MIKDGSITNTEDGNIDTDFWHPGETRHKLIQFDCHWSESYFTEYLCAVRVILEVAKVSFFPY
jgi:hypothetical protein